MCTATWIRDDEGYQLFFNRDERFTRKAGLPPSVHIANGVRFVAPTDGDFGGTWIAVNEFGLAVCLVNGAGLTGSEPRIGPKSRGLLIPEVIADDSVESICARVLAGNLVDFSPFTMAVLGGHTGPALIEWNGATPTYIPEGDRLMPLTSSSFLPVHVRECRRARLGALKASGPLDARRLRWWHASHEPSRGPYSVCMHRNDAETVSFTTILVAGSRASIEYHPGSPCVCTAGVSITELQISAVRPRAANANS